MRAGPEGWLGSALIAVACTAAGVLLFFTGTAPALREHEHLRAVEAERGAAFAELAERLAALRSEDESLRTDPQTILLAIDRAGLTPGELLDEPVPGMPALPAWMPARR
ncbi:MAG TPA: hypothetical protein VK081_11525 [Planctomycetota bacterium]|nr:hypothetical protein [Planctomycetota bacterium]